ncbi:DUF5348 domain-containing protein [Paenibacillus alkaliterrae]|uniref:DUF5348 domain-containing protein n=1 Tax=Paenibacillus alkaliterrae TaxID=320909 RepID=UPI001F22CF5B|nr:DUF5348 domain-containing protein [Paenibacillus alkaliterrae]MCF2941850.1 DUF5348 domain-containing protein [Paenibacillus alkaliterrae]
MRSKRTMRYDPTSDQWIVELQGRRYGLNCGETLNLYIDGEPVPCSVELDRQKWYFIMKDIRFYLRESDEYMVSI